MPKVPVRTPNDVSVAVKRLEPPESAGLVEPEATHPERGSAGNGSRLTERRPELGHRAEAVFAGERDTPPD
jgi:hypothetical protein